MHLHSHGSNSSPSHNNLGGSFKKLPPKPQMTKSISMFTRDKSVEGHIIKRERRNQPQGYSIIYNGQKPINCYGENHNYAYYQSDWEYEDVHYNSGFYDENGKYYDRIVFEYDGVFNNIIVECENCNSISRIDWKYGESLKCPYCGSCVHLKTAIDTYTQDPDYTYFKEIAEPQYESEKEATAKKTKKTVKIVLITYFIIMALFAISVGLITIFANNIADKLKSNKISNTKRYEVIRYISDIESEDVKQEG